MIRFMWRKWTTKGKVLWPGGGRDAAVVTNNIADSEADQRGSSRRQSPSHRQKKL